MSGQAALGMVMLVAMISVIFVGFAAQGTLARQIVDGAKTVKIFGEDYPVQAQIHTIGGFSAHAGQAEEQEEGRQQRHGARRPTQIHHIGRTDAAMQEARKANVGGEILCEVW